MHHREKGGFNFHKGVKLNEGGFVFVEGVKLAEPEYLKGVKLAEPDLLISPITAFNTLHKVFVCTTT